MTDNNADAPVQAAQPSDKELNFRRLEAKYQQEIAAERAKREEIERQVQELSRRQQQEEEPDDSEPYVDHKKLEKKLSRFAEQNKQATQEEIKKAVHYAVRESQKEEWIKKHSDFDQVLGMAEKLYEADPELAETILEMPASFERQKLVYKSIKSLGIDKPKVTQPSIQEKVDANRRSPYYQPSGVGTSPYSSQANFSAQGQKEAYDKMKEMQSRLRL